MRPWLCVVSWVAVLCLLPQLAHADAAAQRLELTTVEARLTAIDAQTGLRGPIVLMADGLVVTAALDLAALAYLSVVWIDAGSYGDIAARHQRNLRWMTGMSLVSLAVGASGAVWFAHRMRTRRALAPERRSLQEQRKNLRDALKLAASADGAVLGLELRF